MKVIKMITTVAGPDVAPLNAGTEYTVADERANELYEAKACHKPMDVQIKSQKIDPAAFGKLQARNLHLEDAAGEHHHQLTKEKKRAEALEEELKEHHELLKLHKSGEIEEAFKKLTAERDELAKQNQVNVGVIEAYDKDLQAAREMKASLEQSLEQADKDNASLKMEIASLKADKAVPAEVTEAPAPPPKTNKRQ